MFRQPHFDKWTGAFAAALGGLDTLVFAGGIGENASIGQARICDGLCPRHEAYFGDLVEAGLLRKISAKPDRS